MTRRFVPAAVFLIALVALLATKGGDRLPVPSQTAVIAAKASPAIANQLRAHGYDHTKVTRLDEDTDRVAFFDGPRIRAVAAVDTHHKVENTQTFNPGQPRYGSKTSDSPWLLAILSIAFLAATATRPLRSMRNLDVLALLAFAIPIVAGDHQLLTLSVLSGYPLLAYLCARCIWRAGHGPGSPATPLVERIPARYIAAAGILLAFIAIGSSGAIDVGFASSAGATLLLHGALPYGHMPTDVVHGDTYPLLNYVLYLPAAAIAPVRDAFDDTSGALLVGLAAALLTAVSLKSSRLTLAWLCFPPVAIAVAAGTNDLLLALAIAAALSLTRRSALALTAGIWIKLAPIALLPLWLARTRGKNWGAAAALSTALTATLLILGGPAAIKDMLHALSFQFDRGSAQSAWSLLGIQALQPIAQAAVIAGIAWATTQADRLNLAAASGAILAALQLSASNWTYLYAVWLFPALALALLSESAIRGRAGRTTRTRPARAPR
jgi:hypothetical protein